MSTSTFTAARPIGARHRAFWRCAWKEYRTLRGLWLAVAALAVMIQLIMLATLSRSPDVAAMLFSTALGATVLYAVGAAATLFAVEHEEETYDLLTALPAEWSPVFFAKLVVTAASSVALLTALVGVSLALGGAWNEDAAYLLLPAIAESIAWGIFMSLAIRRPLVAAVATIAAVSVEVNLVMSWMTEYAVAISDPANYPEAMWWRLAITAVVLLMDVALGRDWLQVAQGRRFRLRMPTVTKSADGTVETATSGRVSTLRMMSRLLWQTWRESWVAMGLTLLFCATIGLFGIALVLSRLLQVLNYYVVQTAPLMVVFYLLSSLYGSQVFNADQRGRHFRFLAEHAARPRLVWFCRHVVWLGILFLLIGGSVGIYSHFFLGHLSQRAQLMAEDLVRSDRWPYYGNVWLQTIAMLHALSRAGLAAILTGYSVGQFASLLVRRSISAGFLAVLIAAVVACWGIVVSLWNLSPTVFILPIAVGFFFATWLRIPDWIIERRSIASWVKMLMAIGVPLVAIITLVPYTRLEQVSTLIPGSFASIIEVGESNSVGAIELPGHREAQEMVRLAESVERPLDAKEATNLESDRYRTLDWKRRFAERNQDILNRAIELSNSSVIYFPTYKDHSITLGRLRSLATLIVSAGEADQNDGRLQDALEKYLAALRLLGHIRRGQTSATIATVLDDEQHTMEKIVDWASHPKQSKELLFQAIAGLDQIYPNTSEERAEYGESNQYVSAPLSLTNDYGVLREVILGKRLPQILYGEHVTVGDHFAVLANRLPFERQRALRVLAAVAAQEAGVLGQIVQTLERSQESNGLQNKTQDARLLRQALARQLRETWYGNLVTTDAHTSYLLFKELNARFDLPRFLEAVANHYVRQLGLKLQLALIAYGLDHGKYPASLDLLVPDYLPSVPIDPYSGEPFKYERAGIPGTVRSGGEYIPSETPFIWSVGSNNNQLVLESVSGLVESGIESFYQKSSPDESRNYRFMPTEGQLWSNTTLAFPLPLIESGDDSTPRSDKSQ